MESMEARLTMYYSNSQSVMDTSTKPVMEPDGHPVAFGTTSQSKYQCGKNVS